MRSRILILVAAAAVAFTLCGCQTTAMNSKLMKMARNPTPEPEYKVAPPDQILIEVKGYPEYTRTQAVRPDGKITVPSVGDIYVQGLSIPEINVAVTEGLKKELSLPSINVQLVASTSKAIYVLGEVRSPGLRPYFGDMRLIDAIASAQGLTFNGDWHKVTLARGSLDHPQVLTIDLRKLVDKGAAEQNVVLEDGDIIYVTPTAFAKVGYAFDQLLLPFRSILSGLVTYGGVRTATSDNL